MINRIKQALSSNTALIICLTLAIIFRIGFIRIFQHLSSDKVGQMVMAKNFVAGKGFTIDYTLVSDLGARLYMPPSYWPPGYSFLLSPLIILSYGNFLLSTFLLDCFAAIILFWHLYQILLLARFPVWLRNLFLLFQGLYIPEYLSNSPDFVGLAALVATVYWAARISVEPKFNTSIFILFILSSSITFFLRYQYMPVVVLLALALLIYGNYKRLKHVVIGGGISLAILAGYGLFYYLYLKSQDSSVYVTESSTGFYPSNLQYLHPFLLSSFINLKVWTRHLSEWFSMGGAQWLQFFRWVNIALLLVLMLYFLNAILKGKINLRNIQPVWLFSGLAAIGSVLVLVFLSLVKDKNIGPPLLTWTYVFTARYFAFPELFIQIVAWRWLFFNYDHSIIKKFFSWLIILIMATEISRSFYIVARRIPNLFPSYASLLPGNSPTSEVLAFVKKEKEAGREVVITGFDKYPAFVGSLYNASGLFSPMQLNEIKVKSSKPAALLLVVTKNQAEYLSGFLQTPGVSLMKESAGFNFYTFYVDPESK